MPAFAEACGPLAENVINIGGFPDYGLLYGYTNLIKLQSALIANLKDISIRANYQEEGNVLPEPNCNRYFKYMLKGEQEGKAPPFLTLSFRFCHNLFDLFARTARGC